MAEDVTEMLRRIEGQRLAALVRNDHAVAEPLHADDYELVTPSGARLSKEQYLGGLAAGTMRYLVFEAESEVRVRVRGDAGILRYRARIEVEFPGEGRDEGSFWHTDYYERRGGRWTAVWSQATRTSEA
jgi:hypothetical protein